MNSTYLRAWPELEIARVMRFPVRYTTEPRLALLAAAHLERSYRPDLIHAHFGWSGLRMLLMRQYLRIPLVVTFGEKAGEHRLCHLPD